MAGYAFDIYPDFHAAAMSPVNASVRRFRGNDKFRTNPILIDDILPAKAIAVFFHDRSYYHDPVAFRDQSQIRHNLCAVYRGCHAAFLIGSSAPVDHFIIFISFIGIVCPVFNVADSDSIDVGVDRDNLLSFSHPSDHISEPVKSDVPESELLHFAADTFSHCAFFTTLARVGDHFSKKGDHVLLIVRSCSFNCIIIRCHIPVLLYR